MLTLRRSILAAGTVLALGVAACDSGPTGLRTGHLSLLLTDAPGDVAAAVVTIESIYIQPDSSGANGRVVLLDSAITVDLLTLQDSLMSVLDSVAIPEGTYGQLRFVISGGYVSVVGTDTTTREIYASSPTYAGLPDSAVVAGVLQMPSFAQSGLKVTLPGEAIHIADDGAVTLVVDFDVAQSFGKLAGNSGRWVMHPVITATAPAAP